MKEREIRRDVKSVINQSCLCEPAWLAMSIIRPENLVNLKSESSVRLNSISMLAVFACFALWSPNVVAGTSGDTYIDTTMGSAYDYRAGGSGGQIDRGGNTVLCNTGGAHPKESMCPNDATYTPAAATGGYQAWGVGTAAVNFGFVEEECYLYVEPRYYNGQLEWVWVVYCDIFVSIWPDGTWGMAIARVKWGEEVQATTSAISSHPTSVVAFHESLFAECSPSYPDGPCGAPGASSYVEDNGYEIEIIVDDPMCSPPSGKRYGDQRDWNANCFTYHQWPQTSNLPGKYQDTTFDDEPGELNIGWGISSGSSIDPGTMYTVRQYFKSKAQPYMGNSGARHSGAITTEFELHAACVRNGGQPEWCFFGVDTASVGCAEDDFDFVPNP